jgi:hypothetical protein
MELQCAKCFVAERIHRKTGERRSRRTPALGTARNWNRQAVPSE